jgi:hypothetical protein
MLVRVGGDRTGGPGGGKQPQTTMVAPSSSAATTYQVSPRLRALSFFIGGIASGDGPPISQ